VATSIRQFNIDLYREHVDEASFLYDQRQAYLVDREVDWPELHQWEERLEAHLDALVVGGDCAADVCLRQSAEGEAGTLCTAIRVLARQSRKAQVFSILEALGEPEQPIVRAAAEALCREAPAAWRDDLARALLESQQQSTRILAKVIGYRRFPLEDALRAKLESTPSVGRAELAWALGRVGTTASVAALRPLVADDDEAVREASAIALLRLGDDRLLTVAEHAAASQPWARLVLVMAGKASALPFLLEAIRTQPIDPQTILSLGLLGDLSAVPPLLELLGRQALSESAAVALNTLTGAELHEVAFVPEQIDRDELLDDERDAYDRDGTLPTQGSRPYGNHERRPLLDQDAWRSWLTENRGRFDRHQRWRMGRPHGPLAVFHCLRNASTPYAVRAATYEELVIAFGLDVPFEADLPVVQQVRYLRKIEQWALEREKGATA
jgi:uncharacterized protein (TIGR02270 family)